MTKADFLDLVREEHQRWESALAEIPLEEMEVAGVASGGNWMVKDLIAHLSWYQREMVGVLQTPNIPGPNRRV
ncbi:MAG: hypothetical protein NTV14_05460 [Coprothermobacterota bacterium]|nr:hypothetical protein [Coprothermobacterota bacterium]